MPTALRAFTLNNDDGLRGIARKTDTVIGSRSKNVVNAVIVSTGVQEDSEFAKQSSESFAHDAA